MLNDLLLKFMSYYEIGLCGSLLMASHPFYVFLCIWLWSFTLSEGSLLVMLLLYLRNLNNQTCPNICRALGKITNVNPHAYSIAKSIENINQFYKLKKIICSPRVRNVTFCCQNLNIYVKECFLYQQVKKNKIIKLYYCAYLCVLIQYNIRMTNKVKIITLAYYVLILLY